MRADQCIDVVPRRRGSRRSGGTENQRRGPGTALVGLCRTRVPATAAEPAGAALTVSAGRTARTASPPGPNPAPGP
ncbi:hypothetical protein NORO109296_09740 [Nocardiopsis rhodophaea]